MSRPFAMWVDRARESRVREPRCFLSGPILGRAPEIGDALVLRAPFASIPVRCRALVGEPRGREGAPFTFGIDALPGIERSRLQGAFLVEDGVSSRAFGATLHRRRPTLRTTARFEFDAGHAWGLVSIAVDALNGVLVGGPSDDLWSTLQSIRLESGESISKGEFTPIDAGRRTPLWRLRTVGRYMREDASEALVVSSLGPVADDTRCQVRVDDHWLEASVIQQPGGLTQFLVPSVPGADTSMITIPVPLAA